MSTVAETLDVRKQVTDALISVFETMLSMPITAVTDGHLPAFTEHMSGSVGFAGDRVNGAVYLHISNPCARKIASAMLGMTAEELGDNEVNDVIGEVCNMIVGGLKSSLCDAGHPCAVSTPGIIRGSMFHIEAVPDVTQHQLIFDSEAERLVVEVHIKFN